MWLLLESSSTLFLLANALTLCMWLAFSKLQRMVGKEETGESDPSESGPLQSLIAECDELRATLAEALPSRFFESPERPQLLLQVQGLAADKDATELEAARDEGRAEREREAESLRQKLLEALSQLADVQEEVSLPSGLLCSPACSFRRMAIAVHRPSSADAAPVWYLGAGA